MRAFAVMLVLLSLAGFTRGDEVDPEPPGGNASVRKLQGKWVAVRQILVGKVVKLRAPVTYTFKGETATYEYAGKPRAPMKFEADSKRPGTFQVLPQGAKGPTKYFFKIEKGELYLIVNRSKDPKVKPDFSGKTMPVLVYKKEE